MKTKYEPEQDDDWDLDDPDDDEYDDDDDYSAIPDDEEMGVPYGRRVAAERNQARRIRTLDKLERKGLLGIV